MKPFIAIVTVMLSLLAQDKFEVVSVKNVAADLKAPPSLAMSPAGITFSNVTTMDVITLAFDLRDYQVTGPEWLRLDRFAISARSASSATDAQLKTMLRSLLEERFKLTSHREMRDLAVYAITKKTELKMKPSAGGPENSLRFQGTALAFRNYTMPGLAKFLGSLPGVDRAISDETGLKGGFDFDIVVNAEGNDPGAVKRAMLDWAGMFADLDRQAGLKIEARKSATDTLVIDRIEKPTPN